jgi:serine protease Do
VIYKTTKLKDADGDNVKEALSVEEVAALVKNSVVEITTEQIVTGSFMQQYISEGAGSGVIITADGYIVTNNHVIDGAEKITVRLTDGTEYPATLVGTDPRTDVGVIKIAPAGRTLTVAVFIEDSKKLVVGDEVLAIGNPLGELGGTVTNGIISALERAVKISGSGTMTLLQTNAAVNPGNSGGGLFNLYGELVGVVNAKSAGNNIEGLGFAIPANTVRDITAQLMQHGYVKGRPTLNATTLDLDSLSAYYYFRSAQAGVYVVESNNSELKYGDRVISVGGKEISKSDDIADIVNKYEIGKKIEVVVVRERSTVTVTVTLTEYVPETSK